MARTAHRRRTAHEDDLRRHGVDWIAPPILRSHDGDGWAWLHQRHHAARPGTPVRHTRKRNAEIMGRRARHGWLTAAVLLAVVSIGLIVAGVTRVIAANQPAPPVAVPPLPTTPAAATTSHPPSDRSQACTGLTATTVTDGPGDRDTAAGTIAAFEHAYYRQRDPAAAMTVLGPQARIDPATLAAGIASIPPGTRHCVAVTPIADQAADVHVVELHPDGGRIDYLQLINVTVAPGATLITGIQARR